MWWESKLEVSIGSLPSEIGEPLVREGRKTVGVKKGWRTPEHQPQNQLSRIHMAHKDWRASTGPARVGSRSSVCVQAVSWRFCGPPNSRSGYTSDPFPPVGCCVQPRYEGKCLVLIVSCFVLFGCQLLDAFLKRKWRGSRSGKEGRQGELGGVERGETPVGMFCMREESNFNFKKKKGDRSHYVA